MDSQYGLAAFDGQLGTELLGQQLGLSPSPADQHAENGLESANGLLQLLAVGDRFKDCFGRCCLRVILSVVSVGEGEAAVVGLASIDDGVTYNIGEGSLSCETSPCQKGLEKRHPSIFIDRYVVLHNNFFFQDVFFFI